MNELQEMANTYIGLLQGAMALRAKAAPAQQLRYEPLIEAMTQLALCLRNKNTTQEELTLAVYLASSVWTEWHDEYTHFNETITREYQEALESGDWITVLGEFMATGDPQLFDQLVGVRD